MNIKARSESAMPPKDFEGQQCRNCCIFLSDTFASAAQEEDIQLWREQGREDFSDDPDHMPF
jgi:hypothetical protein